MSLDELHQIAEKATPADVNVPQTWGGLLVWAVGKWGVGVVFLALLVPVYQDLKISNRQLAEISSANVRVLESLANKVETQNASIIRLNEAMLRLELTKQNAPN